MNRFYKVSITKQRVGSAIEHREPPLQGQVITKVTDSTTRGNFKLIVVDADSAQHKANLAMPGVEGLTKTAAQKLAPTYQPKRTFTEFNPRTNKQETVTLPAVNLRRRLEKPATAKNEEP